MSQVQNSFKRQLGHAQTVAQSAATSTAWLYPIRGVLYLVSHPNLAKPVLPVLLKGVVLSLGIVAAMFFFLYLPHVAVLAFISGPLAFIAAVPLILSESYLIILWLSRPLLGQLETDLFDLVLVQKGHQDLVKRGRQGAGEDKGKGIKLGRLVGNPFAKYSVDSAVRYIITLPLNFIPVVGTACFLVINGYKSGPSYHSRYFQLKNYSKDQKSSAIEKRRGGYTAFGVAALVLNLIPAVSVLFTCTTAVGAALWASDIEAGSPKKSGTAGAGAAVPASNAGRKEL